MMPDAKRLIVFSLLLLAVATSAGAALYTVTLKNGTTFETRAEPVRAEWDPAMRMFRTDRGNWIALPADEIVDVVSSAEASGLGYQLDTTTVMIGSSPQDIETDEEGEGGEGGPGAEQIDYGPASVIDYSLGQFLDMPTANPGGASGGGGGGGGGGLPVWGFPSGGGSGGGGGGGG